MYLNKAIVCGNLTQDPEVCFIPSTGVPVASFTVATNRAWTDANGEKQERTEFHRIVVFGRQVEPCTRFLKKGQLVLVEGRIQTRNWDGEDGLRRYRTEIVAERVEFGPKRKGDGIVDQSVDGSAEDASPRSEADQNDEIPF